MLLLKALALDLACVPVGKMKLSKGVDVVEGIGGMPTSPGVDVVVDDVDTGFFPEVAEDVEPLDAELMLVVDDDFLPVTTTLEFVPVVDKVLVPGETAELDDVVEFCEAGRDDVKGRFWGVLLPELVIGVLLPVSLRETMLNGEESAGEFPAPVPNLLEMVENDFDDVDESFSCAKDPIRATSAATGRTTISFRWR